MYQLKFSNLHKTFKRIFSFGKIIYKLAISLSLDKDVEPRNKERVIKENGDEIEILTSKKPSPSETWENIVKTAKAQSSIKRFFKKKIRRRTS